MLCPCKGRSTSTRPGRGSSLRMPPPHRRNLLLWIPLMDLALRSHQVAQRMSITHSHPHMYTHTHAYRHTRCHTPSHRKSVDAPLKGFTVIIIGRLSQSKPKLTQQIESLGGQVVAKVTDNTTICISNKGTFSKALCSMLTWTHTHTDTHTHIHTLYT